MSVAALLIGSGAALAQGTQQSAVPSGGGYSRVEPIGRSGSPVGTPHVEHVRKSDRSADSAGRVQPPYRGAAAPALKLRSPVATAAHAVAPHADGPPIQMALAGQLPSTTFETT